MRGVHRGIEDFSEKLSRRNNGFGIGVNVTGNVTFDLDLPQREKVENSIRQREEPIGWHKCESIRHSPGEDNTFSVTGMLAREAGCSEL